MKDTTKYQYVTLGLLRGSQAQARFLADAEQHHMADQLGKIAALRLTEYYELKERLEERCTLIVGSLSVGEPTRVNKREPTRLAQTREPPQDEQQPSDSAIASISENAGENADQALSFFLDEEA
jgi:hypothetical protein